MMRIRLSRIIFILILLTLSVGAYYKIRSFYSVPVDNPSPPVTVSPAPGPALPDFKIIAIQATEQSRQLITCQKQKCTEDKVKELGEPPAVTDGQSWFYYQTKQDPNTNQTTLQLRRLWNDTQQSDLIIEQTPLVKPRGLFISPDNKKVAFWLDSTTPKNQDLTELWIFDTQSNSTKLIAEKIRRRGVLTQPRWNRASTHLWFLGETDATNQHSAIHVASIQPPKFSARFTNLDWQGSQGLVSTGPMDINFTGLSLAYAKANGAKTTLHVQHDMTSEDSATIHGAIPYLQWLPDGSLIYVVQGRHSFTFWLLKSTIHRYVARYEGQFQSARTDSQGKYIVFNTKYNDSLQHILALDINTGRIDLQASLSRALPGHVFLIHFEPILQTPENDITRPLSDEEIAAFMSNNLSAITQEKAAPQRLIITDQPNTIYFDYLLPDQTKKRLLLTINDVTFSEWSIKAHFIAKAGEWQKVQGGGEANPKPIRLYEWEKELNQWILKEDLNSSQSD